MSECQRCADLERDKRALQDAVEWRAKENAALQDRMVRVVNAAVEACSMKLRATGGRPHDG